jgi:predicted regulator of Ras-like GTPase activity (Roadblock/LC7/MglB family)
MTQVTELDDRIAKCNKILTENPNSQIFAALAEAYRKKGEVDKAFRICQTGLKVHPKYGSAHFVMAKINMDKGLYDWSEMEVVKAIELDGHSHATDLLLAEIYIQKGEFNKATKLLSSLQAGGASSQHIERLMEMVKKLPLEVQSITGTAPDKTGAEEAEKMEDITKPAEPVTLRELLDAIAELAGVDGVLLINREGLVADSRWDDPRAPELYGALAREIERTIQSQIDISHFGKYENVLIEADDLVMCMLPLKDNLFLIKGNKQLNLGTLRLRLTGLLSRMVKDIT